jgi:peptidyl-tRNA hydrolase, PTH1 family
VWRARVREIFNRKAGDPVTDGSTSSDSGVWLIVGLGNPGPSYAGNRHNIGYLVADELASRMGSGFRPHKSGRADVVEGRLGGLGGSGIGGVRAVLARPRCYMNETGGPVSTLAKFYKVPVERIVAFHDELDIPFDTMRVKKGGGDNGHNGLRSMRKSLDSGEFHRVRVGIGRPPGRQDPAAFVLSNYSSSERQVLPFQVDRAADAVESLLTDGLERTQNVFNR